MSATEQPLPSPTSVTAAPTTKPTKKPSLRPLKQSAIPEMNIDKRIIDELLLVCSVIGSNSAEGEFVPVTDCLAWLQDLQRALRRDNDSYRPIGLLLGQWNVVKTKLLPLVMSCRYDRGVVLTVLKILVILTKPLRLGTLCFCDFVRPVAAAAI
jgi:timeless